MRDSAVRVELGIGLKTAARLAGVHHMTLRLYELDPMSIRRADKRAACERLYRHLRALLDALRSEAA